MPVERPVFSSEPLRVVTTETQPAFSGLYEDKNGVEHDSEKNGQLFFWNNTVHFPENWTIPNPKTKLFPELSLPKILIPQEAYMRQPTERPKEVMDNQIQLHFWDKLAIPEDYIKANQEHWRNAKRGRFSRPLALPRTSEFLNERIVRTFHLGEVQKPDLVWSVLLDDPKTPSSRFVYAERYPEDISDEDKANFYRGIGRMTEYATNYATKEFLKQNSDFRLPKPLTTLGKTLGEGIATVYGGLSDQLTYGILINGTYQKMRELEIMANHNDMDYKGGLLTALFEHDFTSLNQIIELSNTTGYTGYSNLNELAIKIGESRHTKPDFAKWFDKMDSRRSDHSILNTFKNGILSSAAPGVYRNPGITEASLGSLVFFPMVGTIIFDAIYDTNNVGLFSHPEYAGYILSTMIPLVAESLQLPIAIVISLLPFVVIHELIHYYSSNQNYMGLIPVTAISKEVTPYKSRLEREQLPVG